MRFLFPRPFLLLILLSNSSLSQTKSDILKNSVIFNSIDPDNEDYSDLQALKKKLTNVSVVVLGEISHNDGSSFKAKSRLVKFLHKELGFDILAWEAGFTGAWKINEDLKNNIDIADAKKNLMSGGWANSEFTESLWQYIYQTHKTNRPLLMAGFDNERPPKAAKTLTDIISEISALITPEDYNTENIKILDSGIKAYTGYLGNTFIKNLSQKGKQKVKELISKFLENITKSDLRIEVQKKLQEKPYALFLTSFLLDMEINEILSNASPKRWNLSRDNIMAQRFSWIRKNVFPGKKIIIWAASGHLISNSHLLQPVNGNVADYEYPFTIHMGHYLKRELKDSMYNIFCTTYGGEEGNIYPETKRKFDFKSSIPQPQKNSYESIAHQLKKPFFLTDLRHANTQSWLKKTFIARPLGYTENLAEWHLITDAFLFIDKMEPDRQF